MINSSITGRLILWLSLASFIVIGGGLYADYRLSRVEILERVQLQSEDTIRRVVTDLENLLDGIEANTQILGRILAQREYSEEGLEQMLKAVMETNGDLFAAAIALAPGQTVRPQGFAPYFYRRDGLLTSADLTQGDLPYWRRPWFSGAAEARGPVWSEPYFDTEGARVLMTTYSVPVYRTDDSGQPLLYAVVTADITLEELHHYLQHLRLGKSSFALLLSRTGTVLSSGEPGHIMQHYRDLIADRNERQRWGEMIAATADGQVVDHELECLTGAGSCMLRLGALQSTGWPVGVVYSESELLQPLRDFQIKSALVSVLTLLVIALAVFAVSRRLTRPLVALADATEDISRGELNTPLPVHRARDEVGRLIEAFGSMTRDLRSYIDNLELATASRSRLEGELAAARDIQMAMLPQGGEASDNLDELQVWAKVSPAKSVGGDFYRYHATEGGLELAIGDVSDKGVPAALFMARTISLLPGEGTAPGAPDLGMSAVNDDLEEGNSNCMFVTALLARLDHQRGELLFTSAGHPAPVLVRGGKAQPLQQESGPALGLAREQTFPLNRFTLQNGDRLAFYTDGVDEAFSPAGEMFLLEGLLQQLEASAGLDTGECGAAIFAALSHHAGEAPQSDDITLVIIDYQGAAPGTGAVEEQCRLSAADGIAGSGIAWLQERINARGLMGEAASELALVLEEILTNIEKYADLSPTDEVQLGFASGSTGMSLRVSDPGIPFDPLTEARGAELGRDSDTTEIGGLGVHLIKQLTDQQWYEHSNGRNILSVTKTLAGNS